MAMAASTDPVIETVRRKLTRLGLLAARPWAFGVVGLYGATWLLLDPKSLDLHAVATLTTLFMALLIQRAEHRDTQAIHAKLDELLRSDARARTELAGLDDREAEEIEDHRSAEIARDHWRGL